MAIRFERQGEGHYIETSTGIELVRGLDDADGYDRIEWQIWTAGGPRSATSTPLGVRNSLNAAKTRTRELINEGAHQ